MSGLTYADKFFATARKRYQIRLRREAGEPPPWTEDPIFSDWRFCNVHREHDRTTAWFREEVRNHLSGIRVVETTVIFRWFNRIETGERVKDLLLDGWDTEQVRGRLQDVRPLISGAYKIGSPPGLNKLDGLLQAIDTARPLLAVAVPRWGKTLQEAWKDLQKIPFLGPFLAYEIVSDLRWTSVLGEATDVNAWANAGPGCTRGIGWVTSGDPERFRCGSQRDQTLMNGYMRDLLEMSHDSHYWPADWTSWEMREVEHWLCEEDKYRRALRGIVLKRRYDPPRCLPLEGLFGPPGRGR